LLSERTRSDPRRVDFGVAYPTTSFPAGKFPRSVGFLAPPDYLPWLPIGEMKTNVAEAHFIVSVSGREDSFHFHTSMYMLTVLAQQAKASSAKRQLPRERGLV
jgi:hypothetical protein